MRVAVPVVEDRPHVDSCQPAVELHKALFRHSSNQVTDRPGDTAGVVFGLPHFIPKREWNNIALLVLCCYRGVTENLKKLLNDPSLAILLRGKRWIVDHVKPS